MSTPIAISLYPAKQDAKSGHARVTITNTGNSPVDVKTNAVILHNGCIQTNTQEVTVKAEFKLAAGKSLSVPITVHHVSGDVGVVFSATSPNAHGFTQAGAIGAQILTGKTATSCVHPKQPTKPVADSSHAGTLPLLIGLMVLAVLVASIAAVIGYRHTRRPPRHGGQIPYN